MCVCVCVCVCVLADALLVACTDLMSVFCNSGGAQLFNSLQMVSKLYHLIAMHVMHVINIYSGLIPFTCDSSHLSF